MALDLTDTPHPNPEVEKDWQDFWLSWTFREGFTLNDLKAELSDYHRYLTETAKVYVEITGGRVSKQNTTAEAVIGEYQAVLQETVDEAVEDATQHLKAEIVELEGEKEKLRAFIRDLMWEYAEHDVDGGEVQEIAVKHNILVPVEVTEPCDEVCNCSEFFASDEFPVTCHRYSTLINDNGVPVPDSNPAPPTAEVWALGERR